MDTTLYLVTMLALVRLSFVPANLTFLRSYCTIDLSHFNPVDTGAR